MISITYFDPYCTSAGHPDGQTITVTAGTAEEYAAHRAAILAPERSITLLDPLELPEEPDPVWFTPEPDPLLEVREQLDDIGAAVDALLEVLS